jgi:hypothetical protein
MPLFVGEHLLKIVIAWWSPLSDASDNGDRKTQNTD